MRFYDIFWVCLAASLAIGFVNSIDIFPTDYMTQPQHSTYLLTDVNGTLATDAPTDDVTLSVTMFWQGLTFLKDMATNTFLVFIPLVNVWGVPWQLAIVLQTIVAVSWLYFFTQVIMRVFFGGTES